MAIFDFFPPRYLSGCKILKIFANFLFHTSKMPKTTKERMKHTTSLANQLQLDKNPQLSESKRTKRQRSTQDVEEKAENGDQVISGKLGRQILTMAREQQDEIEEDRESEEEEDMRWRENQE